MCPRVLAIDASSDSCSVALNCEGAHNSLIERVSAEPRAHAQRLLLMVDEVLVEAQSNLSDLDFIALINGPGSFTGLRIAISAAQGLAYGAQKPLFALSSLLTMAHQYRLSLRSEALIVTALDARMGELYWALFRVDPAGSAPFELISPQVSSAENMLALLAEYRAQQPIKPSFIGIGNGFKDGVIQNQSSGSMFNDFAIAIEPSASALLSLACVLQPKAEELSSPESIEPLYLRNEVAWKKRVRIRQ